MPDSTSRDQVLAAADRIAQAAYDAYDADMRVALGAKSRSERARLGLAAFRRLQRALDIVRALRYDCGAAR